MSRYVVLEPPAGASDGDVVLVADRFRWLGLIFPFLWLLWHRLWLATFGYLVAVGAVFALAQLSGAGTLQISLLAIGALVALEGPHWIVAKLRRAGYTDIGTIDADTLDDAEAMLAQDRMVLSGTPDGVRGGVASAPMGLTPSPADRAWRASRSLLDPIGDRP